MVAINAFPTDTKAELDLVETKCKELGVNVALSEVWAKGGEGGISSGRRSNPSVRGAERLSHTAMSWKERIEDKLNQIVQKIYGGKKSRSDRKRAEAGESSSRLWAMATARSAWQRHSTRLTDDQTKLGRTDRL